MELRRRARLAGRLSPIIALSATVAGCGAGPKPASPATPGATRATPSESLAAVTVAARSTLATSAAVAVRLQLPYTGRVSGRGVIDFASGIGYDELTQPTGTESVIFRPPAVYDQPTSAGAGPVRLPEGKSWVLDDPTDGGALGFRMYTLQLEAENSSFWLSQLSWGAVSASEPSPAAVGSFTATEYSVSVSLPRARSGATGPQQVPYADVIGFEEAQLGAKALVADMQVWVAGGRVVEVGYSPAGVPQEQVTLTFSDFGVPVAGRTPDPAQTVNVGGLDKDSDSE